MHNYDKAILESLKEISDGDSIIYIPERDHDIREFIEAVAPLFKREQERKVA